MKRWDECGRPNECRWITNGGLDVECRKLRDKCASGRLMETELLANELASRFGQPEKDVNVFLSSLRIDNNSPPFGYIRVLDIDRYARVTLRELGLAVEGASRAYDAVAELVRAAAQGFGDSPDPWLLTEPGAFDEDWLTKDSVARRLITRQQVIEILQTAVHPEAAALPAMTPPVTRLIAKLKAGEIVPSVMAAARRARRAWTEYERGLACPLPGVAIGPDFSGLRTRLTAEAAEAQLRAKIGSTGAYGNDMLADMYRRVSTIACEQMEAYDLNTQLLMGLVYDLTAHCEIWWSDEFEIEDLTS
jgi:hypothetical protein